MIFEFHEQWNSVDIRTNYWLIYIDDNDTPELYVSTVGGPPEYRLYTFHKGLIVLLAEGFGRDTTFNGYIERSGYAWHNACHNRYVIQRLENGDYVLVEELSYDNNHGSITYKINDADSNETEWTKRLEEFTNKETDLGEGYSYNEVVALLSGKSKTAATPMQTTAPITTTATTTAKHLNLNWETAYRQFISTFKFESNGGYNRYTLNGEGVLGIQLYDINGDGIPELFLRHEGLGSYYSIYDIKNSNAAYVGQIYGDVYKVPSYNGIYTHIGGCGGLARHSEYFELVNGSFATPQGIDTNFRVDVPDDYYFGSFDFYNETNYLYYLNHVEVTMHEYDSKASQYFNDGNRILLTDYPVNDVEIMFRDYVSGTTRNNSSETTSNQNSNHNAIVNVRGDENRLNLRTAPNMNADVVEKLPNGHPIKVDRSGTVAGEEGGLWYEVSCVFNGVELQGYASSEFIEIHEDCYGCGSRNCTGYRCVGR